MVFWAIGTRVITQETKIKANKYNIVLQAAGISYVSVLDFFTSP